MKVLSVAKQAVFFFAFLPIFSSLSAMNYDSIASKEGGGHHHQGEHHGGAQHQGEHHGNSQHPGEHHGQETHHHGDYPGYHGRGEGNVNVNAEGTPAVVPTPVYVLPSTGADIE